MDFATNIKFETSAAKDVTVLKVSGSLDAESTPEFKKRVYRIVDEGSFKLVVDFKTLQFVDSMGLGALISLLRRVRNRQGDVKIAGLNKEVRSIFEITRLNRLFEIYPDWEAACKNF